MNKTQIDILNSVIATHFQFQAQHPGKHSLLFDAIKDVLECSQAMAEKFASTHCNMVSFWGMNYALGLTSMSYANFFENMLENKFCNKEGYIKVGKEIICDEIFGYKFETTYFEEYEDVLKPMVRLNTDSGYQIKMKADTSGFHFMDAYVDKEQGLLMGVDPSYRGTPFVMADKITAKNFVWLLEIKKYG